MRIAQMLDTLNQGGAQKMQLFLVQSLRPLGIEITVISLRDVSKSVVAADLESAGARVVTFPFSRLLSPVSFFQLVRFLRREKFDLLQAYLTYSNIIGTLAGRLSGTPVIASLRNAGVDETRYSTSRSTIEVFVLRYLSKFLLANGHEVAEFWQKRLNKSAIDVLVNAVDIIDPLAAEERCSLRKQLIGDLDRIIILSVGRLTRQKGFPILLQAFHKLHEKFPATVLVIAGGGNMAEELAKQIQELNLQESVFLLGVRNDVNHLLGAADIYVNSSFWEGTPVSVLEAMAAGLPVVATTVGENPYLLDESAGLLVPAGDSDAMSVALLDLVENPEKRRALGQAALNRVQSSYNRLAWKRNLLKYYARVSSKSTEYLSRI